MSFLFGASEGGAAAGGTAASTAVPASAVAGTAAANAAGTAAPVAGSMGGMAGGIGANMTPLLASGAVPGSMGGIVGMGANMSPAWGMAPAAAQGASPFLQALQMLGNQGKMFGQGMGQGIFGMPQDPGLSYQLGQMLSERLLKPGPQAPDAPGLGNVQSDEQQRRQQLLQMLQPIGVRYQ